MQLIIRILRKIGLLPFLNLTYKAKIHNKTFTIPLYGTLGLQNVFGTEPWMLSVLEKMLPLQKGLFIDVGVNVGQSLLKLKSIDETVSYIGFEPNISCVYYVEQLIACNKWKNTFVSPFGIAEKTGVVPLQFFQEENSFNASIVQDFRPAQKIVAEKQVLIGGNDLLSTYIKEKIGLIKIDVEGAEWFVIQGLIPFIQQDRPILMIEILPVYSIETKDRINRQDALLSFLRENQYEMYLVEKTADEGFKALKKLVAIEIHGDLNCIDYVFIPKEIADKMR